MNTKDVVIDCETLLRRMFNIKMNDITYLENLLGTTEDFKIPYYSDIKDIPIDDIMQYCHRYGLYTFPTKELIEFLKNQIDDMSRTIEIGSGTGLLSKELNITATDNYQQKDPNMQVYYNTFNQPTIKYGSNVRRMDALSAVKFYKPDNVIASYVTHLYNVFEPYRKGNAFGVDEGYLLRRIKKYIFIGNYDVHKDKPILSLAHKEYNPEWLITRTRDQSLNRIWIWGIGS